MSHYRFWWVFGVISFVLAAINPYISWYALGNLAVVLAGFYVMKLLGERAARLKENEKLIHDMHQNQKRKLIALDDQQTSSLRSLIQMMMPAFTIANAALNIYAYVYDQSKGLVFYEGLPELFLSSSISTGLLLLDLVFTLLFLFCFLRHARSMIQISIQSV